LRAVGAVAESVMARTFGKAIDLVGAAANPRMAPYAINEGNLVRTPEEALSLARSHGVNIPEDINVGFLKNWSRTDANAEYFNVGRKYRPNDLVDWEDFYHPATDKIPVRINAELLKSDEALVAHLGHEMHELNALREIFEASGGSIQAKRLNQLIGTRAEGGLPNNLHEQAWDVADRLVYDMRK